MDRAWRRDLSSGSDGLEADVGAGVAPVTMSRDKVVVAAHLSILCMSTVQSSATGPGSYTVPQGQGAMVPHAMGRNVLC